MITVSLCMIVKNEESVLKRCLDSVADLVEELIIVDTGSTDATKEIASAYEHAKLYDFAWIDDFSAARNYAFSKATQEYIYSADADEVLDAENRERFRLLKEALLPQVEIVQMKYANQLQFGTVYNFDEEYRPKLFKRLREFRWMDPIHETIQTEPVIYDSEVVITHMPEKLHADRDFQAFQRLAQRGERLSGRLLDMYARELFIAGEPQDFIQAEKLFEQAAADTERSAAEVKIACLVAAAAARRRGDAARFFQYGMKVMAEGGNAELCLELGDFYRDGQNYEEAVLWYYNACYETEAELAVRVKGRETLEKLADCYEKLGLPREAQSYRREAAERDSSNCEKMCRAFL